jgi:hypothetical protein
MAEAEAAVETAAAEPAESAMKSTAAESASEIPDGLKLRTPRGSVLEMRRRQLRMIARNMSLSHIGCVLHPWTSPFNDYNT